MCSEAKRLLVEYTRAMLDAAIAANKLADLPGSYNADNYIFLSGEKTRAGLRVKKTQAAYEKHIDEHGCMVRSATQG